MYLKSRIFRFYTVIFFFHFFFIFLIARLCFIQLFRSSYLAGIATKQHNLFVELEPKRGTIFDRNLKPQATNIILDSLYAVPREIKDRNITLNKLLPLLNLDRASLKEKLSRDKSFIWLARKIPPDLAKKVRGLKIKEVGFLKESKRCYPNGYLASHVIGFSGLDNFGLDGLELSYDSYLKGKPGWALILRDAKKRDLFIWRKLVLPKDGYNLVLTIDEVIQYIAESYLDSAFKTFKAKSASIIVINPRTGEILALANRPTFDSNLTSDASISVRRNKAICDIFEPGSVFKIVAATAALEEDKVKEADRFFCENGSYRVANHILHDHKPHGWLNFREVIEQSSNIGTTKVAQILGPEIIYKYMKLFGFGDRLGIELMGEENGFAKEPRFWSKTSIGAVPIGQEVGVTTLQLASAIAAIANRGNLMKPYLVKSIQDNQGELIKEFDPIVLRSVASVDTCLRLKEILVGVVEDGTGKLAKVPGFRVAGKTGTAQKIEPDGRYSHRKFVASFIGFIPADDPVLAIAVIVDEPHPYYFGGVVAAPVFKRVASDVLKYLKVFPKEELAKLDATKETD